ncbi:MAG: HDIG domain-containing protein [Spirochaetes bacterium]|nr:HDIG domain-containing protein [Spirochaetota bacterium]
MARKIKNYMRRASLVFKKPHVRPAIVFALCLIVVSTILLSISVRGKIYRYNIGDIASEDIVVPHDIRYRLETETRRNMERAAERTPLVFDRDQAVLVRRLEMVDVLFRQVIQVLEENPPIGTEDRTFQLIALKSKLPKNIPFSDVVLLGILKDKNPPRLKNIINKLMVQIYDRGVLKEPYNNPLNVKNNLVSIRTVISSGEINERLTNLDELVTLKEVQKEVPKRAYAVAPFLGAEQLFAVKEIVEKTLAPNLVFNAEETLKRIDDAMKSVKPVVATLKKGHTVIQAGETITADMYDTIQIINRSSQLRAVSFTIGIFLLQFFFALIFSFFLLRYYFKYFTVAGSPTIAFTLMVGFFVFTFLIVKFANIPRDPTILVMLLPTAFVAMMISLLNNIYVAVLSSLYMIFFVYFIAGESSSALLLSFSSSMLGCFLMRDIEQRTSLLRAGLIIGVINVCIAWPLGLLEGEPLASNIIYAGLALGNGIVNSILVLGILPIFETVFGVTTIFKLLELSDLNAKIFKEMIIKAPGTYNHSLMVANMAEAACKEIGANHLLARVGGYYHDIGKIGDSGMYIENRITDGRAKTYGPVEYAKLIISHVQKGVEMAEREGLPDSIIRFIKEHHGESTMTYFYHQALEQADAFTAEKIQKEDFKYPGPKPSSPEVAVVMLADAVEAASRSLQDPTVEKLQGLVNKIIYNKLNEGELENSNLTMSDFKKIQKAFLSILKGIYHTRIEYPTKGEVEELEDRVLGKNGDDY